MKAGVRIGVDVGGTFTDLVLHDEERGITRTGKLLTTAEDPSQSIIAGVQRLLRESGTSAEQIHSIVHGTTLITNTVLERTGAKVGLITTEGFRDIVEMGRETRYDLDDLYLMTPAVIVPRHLRLGVRGRIRADGIEHVPLDEAAVASAARTLVEEHAIESVAVAFVHAYRNPLHEQRARTIIQRMYPKLLVSLSAEVAPEIREYERTNTACVNAYVQPRVHGYLDGLLERLRSIGFEGSLYIMLSGGGITSIEDAKAFPVRLIESGPAAGACAAAYLAARIGEERVIAFDMGGTTAKMCLIEKGMPHRKHEFEAGRLDQFKPGSGLPLKVAVVDMIEIGAGGGSIAAIDALGLMTVGPRSAGSVPGPVAYRRGGTSPTVTDADLLLGYLNADYFLGGEMSLGVDEVDAAVAGCVARPLGLTAKAAAVGIRKIVDESMADATRVHLAEKGRDPRRYSLMAFGGAGPVHAYALAKILKVKRVIVPPGAGVMSAFGFLVAAPTVDEVRGYRAPLATVDWQLVRGLFGEMEKHARAILARAGARDEPIEVARAADMRYIGQGFEIEVPLPAGDLQRDAEGVIRSAFDARYRDLFGRMEQSVQVEIICWRLAARVRGQTIGLARSFPPAKRQRQERRVYLEGFGDCLCAVFDRYALTPGTRIDGPAVFEERESSFIVGPDCTVTVDPQLNLIADFRLSAAQEGGPERAGEAHAGKGP